MKNREKERVDVVLVAKSYQNCEQIGEVFEKDGKNHIKVKETCGRCIGTGYFQAFSHVQGGVCFKCGGSGYIINTVRAYSETEYATIERAAEKRKAKKEEERIAGINEANVHYQNKKGFYNGYIMAVLGDTYPIKEELKELGAKYSKAFGWYFPGGEEPESDFKNYKYFRVNWEDVKQEVNGYIIMKDEDKLKEWFLGETAEPSKSTFQGNVGNKIEVELKVVGVFDFIGRYGVTYLHNMTDVNENIYIWSTSTKKLEKNEIYMVKGTIKEHKEYRGVKQTVLTRCKVL